MIFGEISKGRINIGSKSTMFEVTFVSNVKKVEMTFGEMSKDRNNISKSKSTKIEMTCNRNVQSSK